MIPDPRPVAMAAERPSHPDGHQYPFNCCAAPDVWEYDDGSRRCRSCGHDWTGALA